MPKLVTFVTVPNFNLMSFTSAVEAMRVANRLAGTELYRWQIVWRERVLVRASNGIHVMPDSDFRTAAQGDITFVCASFDFVDVDDKATLAFLRKCARHGSTVGGIGTGSYILARAGLLDGYRCTIHWENRPAFSETFPNITVTSNLYEIDRKRITCSGGASSLDMMIHVISMEHGAKIAVDISNQLMIDRVRTTKDHQRIANTIRASSVSPKLARTIQLMESNVETPLGMAELASMVGITQRQMERWFRKLFDLSPHEFYINMRLDNARQLLLETDMSVMEISVACGFGTQGQFTRRFQARHGMTPRQHRLKSLDMESD